MREAIQRKLRTVEESKLEVEQAKETLKGNIQALDRGIIQPALENRISCGSVISISV